MSFRIVLAERTIAIMLLLMIKVSVGYSQLPSEAADEISRSVPKPLPQSPNAASLGRYGEYSVNLFTGLPDISIPIFEAKSGGLTMPITLRYMASGIRVTDQASWVGLGWSVDTGGQITRQVEGKRDEEYFYTHPISESLNACNDYYTIKDLALGVKDWFPDYFSYSFPGKSGKFLLGQAPEPAQGQEAPPHTSYLIPYQPIAIKETYASSQFTKFEITDENGVIYRFGKRDVGSPIETAIETTFNDSGSTQLNATTAWYLMDMYSGNSNDKITCKYQSIGTTIADDESHYIVVKDDCFTNDPGQNGAPCPAAAADAVVKTSHHTYTYSYAVQYIDFENGRVEFVLNSNNRADQTQSKSLKEIKIYSLLNGTYSLVKSYLFNYSYYTQANTLPLVNLHLKLDEVHVKDRTGVVMQKYKFTYNTNTLTRGNVYARDHWNFYNGQGNYNLVRNQVIQISNQGVSNLTIGGANKEPNILYYTEGVLKRIDFPTSGYTEFEYEPHQYFDGTSTPKYAGGLRIAKITSVSGKDYQPTIKTYVYGALRDGAGIAAFNPTGSYYPSEQTTDHIANSGFTRRSYRIRTYFSNSSINYSSTDGSSVYYPYVREYAGEINNNNGYTEYEYDFGSTTTDGSIGLPRSNRTVQSKMFWQRGHLTKKTTYDNQNRKISMSEISYNTSQSAYKKIGWLACQWRSYTDYHPMGTECFINGNYVDNNMYAFNFYTQNTASVVQSGTTETMFDPIDNSKKLVTYTTHVLDPATRQPLETKSSNGNSFEETVIKYKYAHQYTPLTSGISGSRNVGFPEAINALKSKHILSIPIEKYTITQKPDGSNARVTAGLLTVFKPNPANTVNVVPGEIYSLETVTTIPVSSYAGSYLMGSYLFADNRFRSRLLFSGYDDNNRIKEFNRTNDSKTCYLWAYGNTLPVAEVTNALAKDVFYTSFEEDPTAIVNDAKTGQRSSKATGFSKPLSGLTSGKYILSYYQKVNGAWEPQNNIVDVATAYTITLTAQVDEVRFYPINSRLKTFTYDLLRGVDSITDENNQTTRYEYDEFGRLINVKDNDLNILQNTFYHYAPQN